jgi:hypothetical protein
LVERVDIMAMQVLRQPPREVREEDKALITGDPDWERPGREIRVDIILSTALAVVEAELEQ